MNMNNDPKIPNVEPGIPSNAVSVYGQADAMDDFPVLKAFQQYVDAEQAKAQKRMTTLCVFFAIILSIVVGVFVALILSISNAKNDANDKMIQYMLQERERQHAVAAQGGVANPQNDAAFKALTDTVTALQKQLADQQLKMIEEKQRAAEEAVKRAAEAAAAQVKARQPEPPSPDQLAMEKKNKVDAEKIAKAAALLQKQKDDIAKEKERLRQQEIELQRRRLYPEYYQKQDAAKGASAKTPSAAESVTYFEDDEDDDEDLVEEEMPHVVAPVKKPAPTAVKPKRQADGSIRYFDDEDDAEAAPQRAAPKAKPQPKPVNTQPKPAVQASAAVPVAESPSPAPKASSANAHETLLTGKGASSGWTIPLE